MDRPILIGPEAFHRPVAETPGVDRREAFADDHVWAGRSRTDGGTWSGWQVHPGHETYVFQTQGRLRLEFGPGGAESVEGGPGDFVLIPKGVVHREGNPGTEPNEAIVFRWVRASSWSTSTAPELLAPGAAMTFGPPIGTVLAGGASRTVLLPRHPYVATRPSSNCRRRRRGPKLRQKAQPRR